MHLDFNSLLQYYDIENHSAKETANYFNVSVSKIMTELKKHNFHKDKNKHVANIKKTKLENFGDENYNNRTKSKETCLDKYGVDNPFKDTDKIKKSYIDHLGVDHPMKSKAVRDKVINKKDYKKEALKRKETIKNKYIDEKIFNSNKSKSAWGNNHAVILNAIETWAIRDVNKYNCALKNNLNYLSIYDINKLYEVV